MTRHRAAAHAFVLAAALCGPPTPSRIRWFGADRVKHFFVSFFVQGASYSLLRMTNLGDGPALVGATAATAAVGVSKEVWDRRHGKPFEVGDLVWDALGAGAASALLVHTVDDQ